MMIVPSTARTDFLRHQPRIVVADNFEEGGENSLHFAKWLVEKFAGANVLHLHNLRPDYFLQEMQDNVDSPEQLKPQLKQSLMARAKDLKSVLDSSQGQYQCQITVGSSSREIRQSALAFRADVVIYGRHRSFHYENFTDGEVPVKEMISPFLCTVIVPD